MLQLYSFFAIRHWSTSYPSGAGWGATVSVAVSPNFGAGDRLDEIHDGTAKACVRNTHECFGEVEPISGCEEIGHITRRGSCTRRSGSIGQAFKEKRHRDLEHVGGALQATCSYSICALFIFLHLLERNTSASPSRPETRARPGDGFAKSTGVQARS